MKLLIKLSHILSNMGLKKEASNVSELIEIDSQQKKEILKLLIAGDCDDLPEEIKKNLNDWQSTKAFLEKLGTTVKKVSSKVFPEKKYVYTITLPKRDKHNWREDEKFVTYGDEDYDCNEGWKTAKDFVKNLIDFGKAEDWALADNLEVPKILYHGTTPQNLESILENGLECRNESRGISNRYIGCAVFLSEDEAETIHYGEVLLKIDMENMKNDFGEEQILEKIDKEPDINYLNACISLAQMFGVSLEDTIDYEPEQGMSQHTYILHMKIPPKYITVENRRYEEKIASKKNISKRASPALLFPESKVRDSSGSLIVLYHGTSKDFSIEKMKLSKDGAIGTGIYLTPEKTRAKGYGERTLCVYADIKNPIIINTTSGEDPCIEALVLLGIDRKKAEKKVEEAYEKYGYISSQIKILGQKMGYDGIMQYNNSELSEVIVWDKDQLIEVPESLI